MPGSKWQRGSDEQHSLHFRGTVLLHKHAALTCGSAMRACSPGKDPLRPLFVRYKRALRGQSKQG
jgi:hypothetical protein